MTLEPLFWMFWLTDDHHFGHLREKAFSEWTVAAKCRPLSENCIVMLKPCLLFWSTPSHKKSPHWQGQWKRIFCSSKKLESLKYWDSYWNFIASISDILGIYHPHPFLLFHTATQIFNAETTKSASFCKTQRNINWFRITFTKKTFRQYDKGSLQN